MTTCERGDVVLVEFIFSDETGKKLRPAVVVSSAEYNRARHEVVVVAVTGNVERRLLGDAVMTDWRAAGLLFRSVLTGIIRTVKRTMVVRRLGAVTTRDMQTLDSQLRRNLGLA